MFYKEGKAHIVNAENVQEWVENMTYKDAQAIRAKIDAESKAAFFGKKDYYMSSETTAAAHNADELFRLRGSYMLGEEEALWERSCRPTKRYRSFLQMAQLSGGIANVGFWQDGGFAYLFMGNSNHGVIVPTKYLAYIPENDYSDMTPAQVRAALNVRDSNDMDIVPSNAETAITTRNVKQQIAEGETEIGRLEEEMKAVQRNEEKELAALKEQIRQMEEKLYQRRQELLAELSDKKAGLEIQMEQFKTQIYTLENQIYAIECYAGETITFGTIRSGKGAGEDVPLIIHQKFRFLDEEMGKLASLYEIQWDEIPMFESFLQHHPLALDTFAPEEKCVTMVRLSRTGKTIIQNRDTPYKNMLEEAEYYHGSTVGIIIRNGENVYLGWTEEEKVHLDDDLVFGKDNMLEKPSPKERPEFHNEVEKLEYLKTSIAEQKAYTDQVINRAFVFNILQGVIDHSDLLPMPEDTNLYQASPNVVFSMADTWLTDNRFGSFTDIMEKAAKEPQKGDMVLTMQDLYPEHDRASWRYSYHRDFAWENDRGRGDRNRTHDCKAEDNTIYPINLVEYDPPVTVTRYMTPGVGGPVGEQQYLGPFTTTTPERLSEGCKILDSYVKRDVHVFISVKKTDSYRWDGYASSDPRANFELYSGEYINLTYFNSVWLEWVINNRSLGDWRIAGNPVPYAYGIRYLNTALEYIKKREEGERAEICAVDPQICNDPDWPVRLSEWKIEKKTRKISGFQAKRFAVWYNQNNR